MSSYSRAIILPSSIVCMIKQDIGRKSWFFTLPCTQQHHWVETVGNTFTHSFIHNRSRWLDYSMVQKNTAEKFSPL